MDSGDVQLAAYKWSSCSVDKIELISDLTSSHDDFVTSISGTSWDGGNTSASKPLELAYNSIKGGAVGVDMGRNIWQSENPVPMIRAVHSIIHGNANVDEAYDLYKKFCQPKPKSPKIKK